MLAAHEEILTTRKTTQQTRFTRFVLIDVSVNLREIPESLNQP